MHLAIAVNDIHGEWPQYTTTRLAMAAAGRGHRVCYVQAGDFIVDSDGRTHADVCPVPERSFRSGGVLLREVQAAAGDKERVCFDDVDVLLLRNNPNEDVVRRPWARLAPIDFGLLAASQGVIVLNNPATLARSLTKLYLNHFPREVRPDTLVTRSRDDAKRFITDHGGRGVLKPLYGFGGHNVFLVRPEDAPNVNQMFEAVSQDGYVIVQEYLPDAVHGDTRLFVMNGEPLTVRGRTAAVHRARRTGEGDMRSNISAGAIAQEPDVGPEMLAMVQMIRQTLVDDGIFLAGLDIVGDKIMEINIMTPGALRHAELLAGVPFMREVIVALEHKVEQVRCGAIAADDPRVATI